MALKKRKISKSEAEQLYMLEILVECVDLCPGKHVDIEERDCLMVRVEFIDLTPVDITAEEFIKAAKGERCRNKESRLLDERAGQSGKSCLFTRTPSNLIRSIKSTPLSVEVYRIPRMEDRNSRDDGRILLCAATAFLPRCFCDRVAEAKDKIDGLSEPYTLKKAYTLTDERGFPCGSASIFLRLSCFGSSIIDHFTFREKSFVFRGFPLSEKFRCVRLSDQSAIDEMNKTGHNDDTFLSSKILRAANSEPCDREDRTDASSVLTRPQSPPHVSIGQPGFEKLTSAEKLNDRRYRGLVYAAYPDEPTCSCLPTNRSTHPLMCRSGCLRSCCMALRNPNILENDIPLLALPANHVSDPYLKSSGIGDDTNRSEDPTRMKGGGDEEDIRSKHVELLWNDEHTWHEDNINLRQRLMGGSEYAYPPSEMVTTVLYEKNKETSTGMTCRPRPRSADGVMMGCTCPGKDPSSGRTGTIKCARKPCVGADCMIRAFREAQDFVNSLGKVPGLAGLGLMDPSDSPYFGRDAIGRGYGVQEMLRRGYPAAVATTSPNLQCTAPCNTQIAKITPGDASTVSYAPVTVVTVPGRGGVVREAIPTLPETPLLPLKPKKKEDKKEEKAEKQKEADVVAPVPSDVEVGPCGEPKCKSRRKTPGNSPSRLENANDLQKKETVQSKLSPSSSPVKSVASHPSERARRPKIKLSPGPGGDRDTGKVLPVNVSKRVMRYVYTIGEVYPGISYGHKNCIDPRMRVPANMGWLWNTADTVGKLKPRIGWKPGAIGRYLYELLKEAKAGSLVEDSRARSVPSRTTVRRGKAYKPMSYTSAKQAKEGEEETEPPPTLHIHRKDGTYYVTMYPIKGETADDTPRLEEPTKPLQFKLTRSRNDASVASSSTASNMEIEFSPPAAVNRYRRKPDVVHVETQVRQQEILDALKLPETPRDKKERKGKEKKGREKGKEQKGKK